MATNDTMATIIMAPLLFLLAIAPVEAKIKILAVLVARNNNQGLKSSYSRNRPFKLLQEATLGSRWLKTVCSG